MGSILEISYYLTEMKRIARRGKRRAWYFKLKGWYLYAIKRKLRKEYLTAYLRHLRGRATREDYVYFLYHLPIKVKITKIERGFYYKNKWIIIQ
jgi:hypothetical protein